MRYFEFDFLRAVALCMILACHFVRSIGFYKLDIPLGCVGNMIFFAMSGWLLGLAWENRGRQPYGWTFIKRRLLRLSVSLWLFAIPYMIWFKVSGHDVAPKDVLLNLCLCNWFSRLPGMTPYWFITAISVFYFAVFAISRVNQYAPPLFLSVVLSVFAILVQTALSLSGIRYGYIMVMMLCGALAFLNAKSILSLARRFAIKLPSTVTIALGTSLFLVYWRFVCKEVIIVGTPLCYYSTIPIAVLITLVVFAYAKESRMAAFISSVSYEVYLVHAAMLLWMRPVSDSNAVYALVFIAGTFLLALPLHYISALTIRLLERGK